MNWKLTVEGIQFASVTLVYILLMYCITVLRARDILALDPNGRSDPYCIVSVDGSAEQQQKTDIINATLEPQWNKAFQFSVTPPHMWKPDDTMSGGPISHYVKLEMWDHDMLNRDDFMGQVMLPLVDITTSKEPCWYKLSRYNSKQTITGEVKMKIYYNITTVSSAECMPSCVMYVFCI